jgi:hypothetical protein
MSLYSVPQGGANPAGGGNPQVDVQQQDAHSVLISNWLSNGTQETGNALAQAMLDYFYEQAQNFEVAITDAVRVQEQNRIQAYVRKLLEIKLPPTPTNIREIRAQFKQEALSALLPHTPKNDRGATRNAIQEQINDLNPEIPANGAQIRRTRSGNYTESSQQPMSNVETERQASYEGQDQGQVTPASQDPAPDEVPDAPRLVNPLEAAQDPTVMASFHGDVNAILAQLVSELKQLKEQTLPSEKMELDEKLGELQETFNQAMEQIRLEEKTIDNQHQLALADMQLKQVQTQLEVAKEHNASVAERKEIENSRLKDSETYALGMAQANANLTNTINTTAVAMRKIDTEFEAMREASTSRREEHVERMEQISSQNRKVDAQHVLSETRIAAQHEQTLAQNDRQLQTSLEQFKLQSQQRAQEHEASLKMLETKEAADQRRHAESMEATQKQSAIQLAQIQAQQEIANKREDRLLQDAREERILREKIALENANAARQAAQMKMMQDTPRDAKHFLMQIKHMLAEEKKVKQPPVKKIKT